MSGGDSKFSSGNWARSPRRFRAKLLKRRLPSTALSYLDNDSLPSSSSSIFNFSCFSRWFTGWIETRIVKTEAWLALHHSHNRRSREELWRSRVQESTTTKLGEVHQRCQRSVYSSIGGWRSQEQQLQHKLTWQPWAGGNSHASEDEKKAEETRRNGRAPTS